MLQPAPRIFPSKPSWRRWQQVKLEKSVLRNPRSDRKSPIFFLVAISGY